MSDLVIAVPGQTGVVNYDRMCAAIAECYRVDQVKDIRDRAVALEKYAHEANNHEAERQLRTVRLRAERRAGQILREMKESGERDAGGRGPVEFREGTQLADLGVSKKQSHLWQQLAEIPEKTFEAYLPSGNGTYEMLRKVEIKKAEKGEVRESWQGMPEFEQKDLPPHQTIHVHFANEDDVATFAKLVGQNITPKTKSIWFPKADFGRYANLRYVDALSSDGPIPIKNSEGGQEISRD